MTAPPRSNEPASLVLGWRVTQNLEPRFWIQTKPKPKPGDQQDSDLALVAPESIANHTAIIAQSGVGKSFFLGRYIEEVLLKTRARCIVLDPNGDFRNVATVEKADLWRKAAYDPQKGDGKLPHDPDRTTFASRWATIRAQVRVGPLSIGPGAHRLLLRWPSLDMSLLAGDLSEIHRTELYHLHSCVKTLSTVLWAQRFLTGNSADVLPVARTIWDRARESETALAEYLSGEFQPDCVFGPTYLRGRSKLLFSLTDPESFIPRGYVESQLQNLLKSAKSLRNYVSDPIARFYFSKAQEFEAAGIIARERDGNASTGTQHKLEVVDLPSFVDHSSRLLAINSRTSTLWDRAVKSWTKAMREPPEKDRRVPTLLVIDEAQNLIPKQPQTPAHTALLHHFRKIAAEGRKYGLFLVLVSQRPDKLDQLVLSECQNRALMRLGSQTVLNSAREILGLDDVHPKTLEKCLDLGKSRALLVGPWSGGEPRFIYSAARRTAEGGRNLRTEYWATSRFVARPPKTRPPS